MRIGNLCGAFGSKLLGKKKRRPVVVTPPPEPTPETDGTIIVANGTRTAPRLIMTSTNMDQVPPPIFPELQMDTIEGDVLVYQWTPDFNNTTGQVDWAGANTRTTFNTLTANPATPINVKLSEITTGMGLIAHRAKVQKTGSGASEWSNMLWTGPKTVPAITSPANMTVAEKTPFEVTVTTNLPTVLGVGGTNAARFERVTSDTAYLTTHKLRLVGNGVANYNAGDTAYSLNFTATNKAGMSSPLFRFGISVTNNVADDPITSGWDPTLEEEDYNYADNNRVALKVINGNGDYLPPNNGGVTGSKVITSGVHWVELYLEANDSGQFPWMWTLGFRDVEAGMRLFTDFGNIHFRSDANVKTNDLGMYHGPVLTKRKMMVLDLDVRKVYFYEDGVPIGRREDEGGWGGPVGTGYDLPASMTNFRPYSGFGSYFGTKCVLNTGQFAPLGGVPTVNGKLAQSWG